MDNSYFRLTIKKIVNIKKYIYDKLINYIK